MRSSPRSTPRLVRALLAGGVAVLVLATGVAGAEERYPVRSSDDASSSFANRPSAVGTVLTPLGARVERISAYWFQQNPGPPNAGSPFALAAHAVLREADDRLKAISADWFQGNPGPPTTPEQQALAGVYDSAVAIAFGASTILVLDYFPPNPVCEG